MTKSQPVTQLVVRQLIEQRARSSGLQVITDEQRQHQRLDEKRRHEIGPRGFPAESKGVDGAFGSRSSGRLRKAAAGRSSSVCGCPMIERILFDHLAKIIRLLDGIDDAGARESPSAPAARDNRWRRSRARSGLISFMRRKTSRPPKSRQAEVADHQANLIRVRVQTSPPLRRHPSPPTRDSRRDSSIITPSSRNISSSSTSMMVRAAFVRPPRRAPGRRPGLRSVPSGQIDSKSRAVARLAIHLDKTVVCYHHAVNNGQTEAGSFSPLFRGVKRLEDMRLHLLADPDAGIDHPDIGITLRLHPGEVFAAALPLHEAPVSRVIVPSFGMASRAFTQRLSNTW